MRVVWEGFYHVIHPHLDLVSWRRVDMSEMHPVHQLSMENVNIETRQTQHSLRSPGRDPMACGYMEVM